MVYDIWDSIGYGMKWNVMYVVNSAKSYFSKNIGGR